LDSTSDIHWIVSAARATELEGAEGLVVPQQADAEKAWGLALEGTGVTPADLAKSVAKHFGIEVADMTAASPGAARLIPGSVLEKHGVVPIRCTDTELVVATPDPADTREVKRELSNLSGRRVVFEVASPDAVRTVRLRNAPPSPPTRRVLVVEDDPDDRLFIRTVLETVGFDVDEAEDGVVALEKIQGGGDYDVITLDLFMDNMDGLELLDRLRADPKTAMLPILVATSSTDPAMQMRTLDAGADDYVVKPIDPTRLVLRVRAVLRRHEKRGLGYLV
jgi:CheY-like chemotaxis protein